MELPEEETHDSATRTLRDQGCERQLPGGGQVGVDQSVVQERQVQPQHVLRRWAKAPHHRFEFHLFRVLLLRRLHLPLPPCLPSPPLRADGEPHRRCLDEDGVALTFARRRPERTYPEVTSGRSSAKLVVVARETHSRFSEETQTFLRLVAGLGLAPCPSRCALAPASLSCTDGAPSCPVRLPGPSRALCWVCTAIWTQTATRLRSLTCSVTFAMIQSRTEEALKRVPGDAVISAVLS